MISSVELITNLINKEMYKSKYSNLIKHLTNDLDLILLDSEIQNIENLIDKDLKAINYTHCCEELNPEFAIGEQVLLTKRTVVTIETFCEDGMIEIDDNNEYYKVDKDELSKRV